MTNDKLLAVLNISEDEQIRWVAGKFPSEGIHSLSVASAQEIKHPEQVMTHWNIPRNRRILADLAFRLRDEVYEQYGDMFGPYWHDGKLTVAQYLTKNPLWFDDIAKPIHWIIAALIAKETT